MKALTLPIVGMNFRPTVGKTAVEVRNGNSLLTVWANGDQSGISALLANIVVNEVGDKFVATSDSKQFDANKKPLFKKGETVVRNKESYDFKSFGGQNRAAEFAQAASAFGLQLVVQM
jgi:hypothetical protein